MSIKKPFAFVRYNDGEYWALVNQYIDKAEQKKVTYIDGTVAHKHFSGHIYDPNNSIYRDRRIDLMKSFTYDDPNYHIGIIAPCCDASELGGSQHMIDISAISHSNLTYATLFFNYNYQPFHDEIVPFFNRYPVVMVCNSFAKYRRLPFDIKKVFRVEVDAWIHNYDLIDEMKKYIKNNNIKNHLFVFCAGIFSKILIYELYKTFKHYNNTYLDIGAPLDKYMFIKPTRDYMNSDHPNLRHKCSLHIPKSKDFIKETCKFKFLLEKKVPFTMTCYGDEELSIIDDTNIDLTKKFADNYHFDKAKDQFYRKELIDSFTYQNGNYYVGVKYPCCLVGKEAPDLMKESSRQNERHLTWANIWINNNSYFQKKVIPLFNKYQTILVCHKDANINNLPFKVGKCFRVSANAWIDNYDLITQLSDYIKLSKVKNSLFLFCAGPFSNILCYYLNKMFGYENTYLNIGSTLDKYFSNITTKKN